MRDGPGRRIHYAVVDAEPNMRKQHAFLNVKAFALALASGLGLQPAPVLVPPLLDCGALPPAVPVPVASAPFFSPVPLACPPPWLSGPAVDCPLLI